MRRKTQIAESGQATGPVDETREALRRDVVSRRWRRYYNTVRPHNSLGYRAPAPEAIAKWPADSGAALLRLPAMSEQEQTLT